MVKKIILILLVVVLAFAGYLVVRFFMLGAESAHGSAPGLVNGQLTHCPPSPNCVNSEYAGDTDHLATPVTLLQDDSAAINRIVIQSIESMGGRIVSNEGNYIAATFTSRIFRFVDDFEVRIDENSGLMHVRSASRVGYGDMGVNARRVEKFQKRFANRVADAKF